MKPPLEVSSGVMQEQFNHGIRYSAESMRSSARPCSRMALLQMHFWNANVIITHTPFKITSSQHLHNQLHLRLNLNQVKNIKVISVFMKAAALTTPCDIMGNAISTLLIHDHAVLGHFHTHFLFFAASSPHTPPNPEQPPLPICSDTS